MSYFELCDFEKFELRLLAYNFTKSNTPPWVFFYVF